jgi:hypothetical protein
MPIPSYAYICAVCEVEVDPETGLVECYVSIDDCGRAVNPLLIRPEPWRHRAGDRPGAVGAVRV